MRGYLIVALLILVTLACVTIASAQQPVYRVYLPVVVVEDGAVGPTPTTAVYPAR